MGQSLRPSYPKVTQISGLNAGGLAHAGPDQLEKILVQVLGRLRHLAVEPPLEQCQQRPGHVLRDNGQRDTRLPPRWQAACQASLDVAAEMVLHWPERCL